MAQKPVWMYSLVGRKRDVWTIPRSEANRFTQFKDGNLASFMTCMPYHGIGLKKRVTIRLCHGLVKQCLLKTWTCLCPGAAGGGGSGTPETWKGSPQSIVSAALGVNFCRPLPTAVPDRVSRGSNTRLHEGVARWRGRPDVFTPHVHICTQLSHHTRTQTFPRVKKTVFYQNREMGRKGRGSKLTSGGSLKWKLSTSGRVASLPRLEGVWEWKREGVWEAEGEGVSDREDIYMYI